MSGRDHTRARRQQTNSTQKHSRVPRKPPSIMQFSERCEFCRTGRSTRSGLSTERRDHRISSPPITTRANSTGDERAPSASGAKFSPESAPVILPRELVHDIDTPEDWANAELAFTALRLAEGRRL